MLVLTGVTFGVVKLGVREAVLVWLAELSSPLLHHVSLFGVLCRASLALGHWACNLPPARLLLPFFRTGPGVSSFSLSC